MTSWCSTSTSKQQFHYDSDNGEADPRLQHYLPFGLTLPDFFWARSLPATVFSVFVDALLLKILLAFEAAFLPVAILRLLLLVRTYKVLPVDW
jgi:hypothetical protein